MLEIHHQQKKKKVRQNFNRLKVLGSFECFVTNYYFTEESGPVVRAISEDEVSTVPFSEIVYPLPGHDIEYPKNVTADWYKETLSSDNISSDMFLKNNK